MATSAFNSPAINLVGSLGVDVLRANGFGLRASGFGLLADGRAFAALKVDKLSSLVTGLHSVNLATGAASVDGNGNATLSGLIVSAVPEPETHALMPAGLMGLGMMVRRRRR